MSNPKLVKSSSTSSNSSDDSNNANVLAALKVRLQSLERENVTLQSRSNENEELLLKAKEQKAKWFKKARELREKLVEKGENIQEFEEDEPIEAKRKSSEKTKENNKSNNSSTATSTTNPSSQSKPPVYTAPHVISFAGDSPFFRKNLSDHLSKVENLGHRLKSVIDKSQTFCSSLGKFSSAAADLSSELERSWKDVEENIDSNNPDDPVSLSSAMGKLGAIVGTLSEISLNLRLSVDAFLIQSFDDFRTRHISACQMSAERVERMTEDYEASIAKRLSRKKRDMGPSGRLPSPNTDFTAKIKGSKSDIAAEEEARKELATVASARRQLELLRFDHTALVNEILTERRMELIEMVCASFLSFITFFHEGCYNADTLKTQIDSINSAMQIKSPLYKRDKQMIATQRKKIELSMNSLSSSLAYDVQKIIPTAITPSLLPSANDSLDGVVMRRGQAIKLEKSGYLRKQSSSLKKDWKRRWFSLEQGSLCYVRSPNDLIPVIVVNALICTVRPAQKSELDLCFDLISPNKRVYTLQAETEEEMNDWIKVFQACVESMLSSSNTILTASERGLSTKELARISDEKEINLEKLRKFNPRCADCEAIHPDWASINLGIMICIACSGIHRSLGVHISKVRSITLDSWTAELLELMLAIGNNRYNELYDNGSEGLKPSPSASRDEREEYITLKYSKRMFLSKSMLNRVAEPKELIVQFLAAVEKESIRDLMGMLALQVNIDDGIINEEWEKQRLEKERKEWEMGAGLSSPLPERKKNPDSEENENGDESLEIDEDDENTANGPRFHFNSRTPTGTAPASPKNGNFDSNASVLTTPQRTSSPSPSPPSQSFSSSASSSIDPSSSLVLMTRALHIAARYDKVVSLEYLLQNNAHDDLKDELNRTPLQVAVEYKSERARQRLSKKVI